MLISIPDGLLISLASIILIYITYLVYKPPSDDKNKLREGVDRRQYWKKRCIEPLLIKDTIHSEGYYLNYRGRILYHQQWIPNNDDSKLKGVVFYW